MARRCPRPIAAVLHRKARHDEPKEKTLSNTHTQDDDDAPVPWMQQLLDNPFLLLFLGVFVPMVLYTVWGVYDILTLPMAK